MTAATEHARAVCSNSYWEVYQTSRHIDMHGTPVRQCHCRFPVATEALMRHRGGPQLLLLAAKSTLSSCQQSQGSHPASVRAPKRLLPALRACTGQPYRTHGLGRGHSFLHERVGQRSSEIHLLWQLPLFARSSDGRGGSGPDVQGAQVSCDGCSLSQRPQETLFGLCRRQYSGIRSWQSAASLAPVHLFLLPLSTITESRLL